MRYFNVTLVCSRLSFADLDPANPECAEGRTPAVTMIAVVLLDTVTEAAVQTGLIRTARRLGRNVTTVPSAVRVQHVRMTVSIARCTADPSQRLIYGLVGTGSSFCGSSPRRANICQLDYQGACDDDPNYPSCGYPRPGSTETGVGVSSDEAADSALTVWLVFRYAGVKAPSALVSLHR